MAERQKTLKRDIALKGIGLHTGKEVSVCLKPAPVDTGLCFKRTDLPDMPEWRVSAENISLTNAAGRCTIVGKGESAVQTIEHLTAALFGLGIDNVLIETNGSEVPGMDGSAMVFIEEIRKAGMKEQDKNRDYIVLKNPVSVSAGEAFISVVPSEEFKVTYVLDYPHPQLSSQVVNFTLDEETFVQAVAPARTFCLNQEAKVLQESGFGKGANTQNTLVMDDQGPRDNTMRFEDECARHKVLDLIGDLSFLGKRVKGHVFAVRSGHYLNARLVKKIYETEGKKKFCRNVVAESKESKVDIRGIMNALPHRYPFLLVDRILEFEEGKRAIGLKNLTVNEPFFQGHFPTKPIMPGVLMIEAMAQLGGILLKTTEQHQDQVGLFMAVDHVRFRRTAGPGDQLIMEVNVVRDRARTASLQGIARIDEEIVVEADMMFSFMSAEYLFG